MSDAVDADVIEIVESINKCLMEKGVTIDKMVPALIVELSSALAFFSVVSAKGNTEIVGRSVHTLLDTTYRVIGTMQKEAQS